MYPLAELTQAEDVAALRAETATSMSQLQQPAAAGCSSDAAVATTSAATDAEAGQPGADSCSPAALAQAEGCSDGAAVMRSVQQHMVHLTMLLCSRNLWMRPAVLEAPAQDPQYLEAIHKVTVSTWAAPQDVTSGMWHFGGGGHLALLVVGWG